jgi:hypothetical protein
VGKKVKFDEGFMVPINLFSPDREALNFIESQLVDRGWVSPGWLNERHSKRGLQGPGYRKDFFVEEGSLNLFKDDLVNACLPFNLEPYYLKDNIIAITEIKGGLNG